MKRRSVLCFTLTGILSIWSTLALALDPALDVSQYAHTAWRAREGFPASAIEPIAQTQDGYLWLGTEFGLVRFDGARVTPWKPPPGESLPDVRIRNLFVSRDGALWIATYSGLASWDGSKLRTYPEFDGGAVNALLEDRDGTLWVAANRPNAGVLCAIRKSGTDCTGGDGSFGRFVGCLYLDNHGALWVAASDALWRWKPGASQRYPLPASVVGLQCLSQTPEGAMLVATQNGIQQLMGGKFQPMTLPVQPQAVGLIAALLRDRDGGVWIGTQNGGLLHVHDGRTDSFGQLDGLSGAEAASFFEDREGSIWVATIDGGLDRFRALPATTFSAGQGLEGGAASVLPDKAGTIWVSTTAGLYRRREGRFFAYRSPGDRAAAAFSAPGRPSPVSEIIVENLPKASLASMFEDSRGRIWLGFSSGFGYLDGQRFVAVSGVPSGDIVSIAQDKQGNLWLAHRFAGLLRIAPDLTVQRMRPPNGKNARDLGEWRVASDPSDGSLWLGTYSGDVIHLVGAAVQATYSTSEGLGKGIVTDLRVAEDGTVWASTSVGLSRIKGRRVATLNGSNGLPCGGVNSSIEDGDGATWIYAPCGLVRIAREDLDAWIAAVDQGKSVPPIRTMVFDNGDGVHSTSVPAPVSTPHLTRARDGRLWFTALDGVTVVDPKNLHANTLPPPVHVEQLVADRKAHASSERISLPPLIRDLTIDYTALSLVAPEKIQFRYMLEGRDRDWEDAGNRRQAFYTDLAPGNYRFRVIASNNSGVWNEEGASLAFTIAPALWQSYWFLALCATALVVFLWDMYRLRIRQLARAQAAEKHQRDMEMEAERRQLELETELAHASRLATLGQLTASIAHEVNQPLGATVASAQAALRWMRTDPPDMGEVKQALNQIVQAGNRAAEVVARVRSMGKKSPGQAEDLVVNNKITAMLAVTNSEIVKHGIAVRTELAPDLPLVKGDRVQLQQVTLNLIVNAVEAMSMLSEGPRELTITSERTETGDVLVCVRDSGPGLTPEASTRLFQPFYTSKKEGLGLGLSICRSIIEAHHGKLWASANTPRGAVFQFTLPPAMPA